MEFHRPDEDATDQCYCKFRLFVYLFIINIVHEVEDRNVVKVSAVQ